LARPSAEREDSAAPAPKISFDTPVAFELTGVLLDTLTEHLQPGEQVLASLENQNAMVGIVATDRRVLILRAGSLSGQYARAACRELPYGSIAEVRCQQLGALGKLQLLVRTIGGKPEVGVRGRMGKIVPEDLAAMPGERLRLIADALRRLIAQAEAKEGPGA